MPSILNELPALYKEILPDFFASEIPVESKATCANCAMCAENCDGAVESADGPQRFFEPSTKCCTFHPNLPNYLVGAILADESPEMAEGRNRILAKIESRVGVSPYGISAPGKYSFLYGNSREFFGRSLSMRCPYFMEGEAGSCSIWKYRESVCSTYFCKHVSGAAGRKFWSRLKTYLAISETQLTRFATLDLYPDYVLSERHPTEPPGRKLTPEEIEDKGPSEESYKTLWGSWQGMEKEYFLECYRLVRELKKEDFTRLVGLDGEVTLQILRRDRENAVEPKLPPKLKLNPELTVKWLADGSVAVGGYSELDALAMASESFLLLKDFRGDKTVAATRQAMRAEKSSDFADELLVTFYQHRVLIEA